MSVVPQQHSPKDHKCNHGEEYIKRIMGEEAVYTRMIINTLQQISHTPSIKKRHR